MQNKEPFKMYTMSVPGKFELHSAAPVTLEGWTVQVSVTSIDTILVIMKRGIKDFAMGYFKSEEEANEFINFWVSCEPD